MPFQPPPRSQAILANIDFTRAAPLAADIKAAFDQADHDPENSDPSKCKALLRFPDGTVFWSSKLGIDADGPAAGPGFLSGSQLDPDTGQDETSFPGNGRSLPAELVPYFVLPGGSFRDATGLELGNVAAIVLNDRLAYAVAGDIGPPTKIGEGSIRLHELLSPAAPDPCKRRDGQGRCTQVRNSSVEQDVLFFVFRDVSLDSEIGAAQIEAAARELAMPRFQRLTGAVL